VSTAPLSRRAALAGALPVLAAASLPAMAAALPGASVDAELLRILAEIDRLWEERDALWATLEPLAEERDKLLRQAISAPAGSQRRAVLSERLERFYADRGLGAAEEREEEIYGIADPLTIRMIDMPARTQEGRAAKVRSLLRWIMRGGDNWLGPDSELDWPIAMCRRLLGEYAGLDEVALAAIGGEV
jgi:hypothetical protein